MAKKSKKDTCSNCCFIKTDGNGIKGKCRRFPNGCTVRYDDWCGEYKSK